jgi:calpain
VRLVLERVRAQEVELRCKFAFSYLRKSFACQAFITCSRRGDWRNANKAEKNGLVQGHAYTITGLYRVDVAGRGKVSLIRVRNPWGDKNEWTGMTSARASNFHCSRVHFAMMMDVARLFCTFAGAWSDVDPNWQLVSEEARRALGLHKICDGEFWMEFFVDFCREFEEVSICTLGPDFNRDGLVDNSNAYQVVFGEWVVGQNAGGCRNNMQSFGINPQVRSFEFEFPIVVRRVLFILRDSTC